MGTIEKQNGSNDQSLANTDVVVPTYGRGKMIDVTIAALRRSSYKAFTLWVVDQSDDDATKQVVASHAAVDKRVRYVRLAGPGSNSARNAGVALGKAPYIIFTDDDCRPEINWLGAMVSELSRANTWAVFGRVIPDTTADPELPSDAKPVTPGITIALKDTPQREIFQGDRFNLGFGHGANMGFRREAFLAIGGFDEFLGAGKVFRSWPERDIGYRMLSRGGRIVYTPEALVYHRHWRGWEEVRRTYRNYAYGTGAAIGKYIRCGDQGGWYLLFEWLLDQGVRQVLSGILKWRSSQKVEVGLLQLIYPWVGLAHSLRYPVAREKILYESVKS